MDRLAIDYSAIDNASNLRGESDLRTIVSTLTRLFQRKQADVSDAIEYEYEYRDAEYEYEDRDAEYEENRMTES